MIKRDLKFEEQRTFEKQAMAGSPDLPLELLKVMKLRMIVSRAWMPLGITKDEAADILIWAIGEDIAKLHFSHWPIRIMENTGIIFDSKVEPIVDVLRRVAVVWRKKHPLIILPGQGVIT